MRNKQCARPAILVPCGSVWKRPTRRLRSHFRTTVLASPLTYCPTSSTLSIRPSGQDAAPASGSAFAKRFCGSTEERLKPVPALAVGQCSELRCLCRILPARRQGQNFYRKGRKVTVPPPSLLHSRHQDIVPQCRDGHYAESSHR